MYSKYLFEWQQFTLDGFVVIRKQAATQKLEEVI